MSIVKIFLLSILPLSAWSQNRFDVVIDEIMADPAPQVGLPNNEWIELKNTTTVPISLQGWRIGDAASQSGPLPNFILQPDSFVIVCTGSAVAAMSMFGTTVSVTSFPSLDNSGDQLFLKTATGKVIHAISYSESWYQNELKKQGGWTLEMIDTKNPCTGGGNWKASIDPAGGSPGRKNSVDGINIDDAPPRLKRTYTLDSITIIAVFDEPVDSLLASAISNYQITGLSITSALALTPLFNQVQLKLSPKMQPNRAYELIASNIKDCKGNLIGGSNKAKAGLPVDASPLDIVVNEILFNPRSGAYDFVELYNHSEKVFDISKIYIANRNSSGVINSLTPLSTTPWLIFPDEYPVVTEDASHLQLNYLTKNPDWLFNVSSLPSFPDNNGFVLLVNAQGNVVDEVDYDHDWQFKLLNNEEGVSLERIDPNGGSQDPLNWHSAASTAGYATPTYQNSQYKLLSSIDASVKVTPKIFSPDNDGHDDVATLQYQLMEPGYVANVNIFDVQGRPVRYLVKNGTLGLTGYWNWDGLDEKGNKLSVGIYIFDTEIFNLQGKKEHFKNTVVLARRLE